VKTLLAFEDQAMRHCLGWTSILIWAAASTVLAQQRDPTVPPAEYYIGFSPYFEGEYKAAADTFAAARRGGIRSTEGVWVDSICYFTMRGECFYQMGDLAGALEQYNQALKLAVFHADWMLRIEFPELIEPSASGVRTTITWGVSRRNTQLARIPDRMASFQGQLDNRTAIERGGIVASPQLFPLNVKEVVRCTCLAIRRRREIMGPVCRHDPFTGQLMAVMARRATRPNHWSQSWVSCQLGLAYASAGKMEQAASELTKSLLIAGQYDHELTSMALVELGKLAFEQGQHNAAATYFLEATFAAAAFDQYDVMQEAFRWGLITHLVSGQKGPYAPLVPAAAWARRGSRALQAWLLLLAAENAAAVGDTATATGLLGETRQTIGMRDMRGGAIGAYFNYQSALVEFQRGNFAAGTPLFTQAMTYMKGSSRRLFQIGLADVLYGGGTLSQRLADEVFGEVLREPTAADWTTDPMETLAVVLTPHLVPMQHWFEVVMLRKDIEKALEIADRIRRHRFYSTLPEGGRVLSLRWLLEGSPESLTQQAVLQRQDLLARYPNYAKLSAQSAALRKELESLPLASGQPEELKKQTQLLEQLAQTSLVQEAGLQEIALRREPAEFVFPPLRTVKEIREGLAADQLVLAYLATERYVTGFALSKDQFTTWQVEKPAEMLKLLGELLIRFGLSEKKVGLNAETLNDESWKATSTALLQKLTNVGDTGTWNAYHELIVVPDGVLWYVPFEALQVPANGATQPLMSKMLIRYVPTLGLVNGFGQPRKPNARTLIVAGPLYPGQDKQLATGAADEIRAALPDSVPIQDRLPAPSGVFSSTCDRLVVLTDLEPAARNAYAWSPMALDRGKAGGALDSWLLLPWQGPAEVVLPGFHTAAESGLKRGGNGSEVFLAVCGLMASGTRSALLSRWSVAGQSAYDLVGEYVQELPHSSAAEAWQRAVQLARQNPIDAELEPRVSAAGLKEDLTGEHPFFWAGYMLVDTGTKPKK
jgi:tetratricopeptide (TPR) repeat protein